MIDETEPEVESDLRRRAAWLLAMLAVVAVLFVVIMAKFVGGGSSPKNNQPGALDSVVAGKSTHPSSHHPSTSAHRSSTSPTTASTSASTPKRTSCPTKQACVLDGDIGSGVAAINAYRTQHGQPAVSGSVSAQAQQCAVHNGSGCSGGWAETQVSKPDGTAAVQKILQFAHLLDPNVKSFEVGWAYDPGAKQYYFAIIRND